MYRSYFDKTGRISFLDADITPLLYQMNYAFDRHYEASFKLRDNLQSNLAIVDAKIEELEENYYVDKKVPAETYDRLMIKLAKEKKQILDNLAGSNIESSNLKDTFEWAINISLKLPLLWDSGGVGGKRKFTKTSIPQRNKLLPQKWDISNCDFF